MNQLQNQSPQMFQMISQARNNGGNPQQILKQMVGRANPTQMQQVLTQARGLGVPDNILSQIQNLK